MLKTVSEEVPLDDWYFRVRQMPEDYEINLNTDEIDPSKLTVYINYRVYDYVGQSSAPPGSGSTSRVVGKLIETYEERYRRRIFFVDREGKVVLHGKAFDGPEDLHRMEGLAGLATQILTTPGGSYTADAGGRTLFLNSRYVPEFDWYLIVEQTPQSGSRQPRPGAVDHLGLVRGDHGGGVGGWPTSPSAATSGGSRRWPRPTSSPGWPTARPSSRCSSISSNRPTAARHRSR